MALDTLVGTSIHWAFALLFLAAAAHKMTNVSAFLVTIRRYVDATVLARPAAVAFLASIILLGEALVGVACLLRAGPGAAAGAATLLLLYGAAMAYNLHRGIRLLDCGCTWGVARQPVHVGLVARNAALSLLSLAMAMPVAERPLSAIDGLSILAGLSVVALLYAGTNRLLALGPFVAEVR